MNKAKPNKLAGQRLLQAYHQKFWAPLAQASAKDVAELRGVCEALAKDIEALNERLGRLERPWWRR